MGSRTLLWVDLLNRAVQWHEPESWRAWLGRAGAAQVQEEKTHAECMCDVSVLRSLFAVEALGRSLRSDESAQLEAWLAQLTIRRTEPVSRFGFHPPALRCERRASTLPAPLETLLSTGLLQLLGSPDPRTVSRCAGLLRGESTVSGFMESDEMGFARQAGLTEFLEGGGLVQCPHLVLAPRRARYCSKSCSNSSFVVRKGAREPRYFAIKQKSYRIRQGRHQDPAHRGALVFLDD